jgi:hypothetical protein
MSTFKTTSIVAGDIVFTTCDGFDFSVYKLAVGFAQQMTTYVQAIDLHWNPGRLYTISDNGKVFYQETFHSWVTARTIEPITKGIHYIELEITTHGILVGVVEKDFNSNDYIHSKNGWGLFVDEGTLHHTISDKPYIPPIQIKSNNEPIRIGMIIDMERHTLTFSVDGDIKPVAFDNLPNEVYVAGSTLRVGEKIKINQSTRFSMLHSKKNLKKKSKCSLN